jgi:hypothetical protein
MLTKEKVLEGVSSMPGEFSIDDLVEKLIFIQKVENGLRQSRNGEVFSTQDAKSKLREWSK